MFTHLHPDPDELRTQKARFARHLRALLEQPESGAGGLSYLPTPSGYRYAPPAPGPVQLLVIGGTRTESILYSPETKSFERHRHAPTPVLHSSAELLKLVDSVREPTKTLLLNFTFPMRPHLEDETLDGLLLRGTKAHTLTDLTGQLIGHHLHEQLPKHPAVVVVNDITTLLTSFAPHHLQVAGVLGTGSNFGLTHAEQCVNLETGNYADFSVDEAVRAIDTASPNPGAQLWEKSISGKYLKDHFNHYAAQSGLDLRLESSHQLDDIHEPAAAALSRAVYRRSASKVALTIAALLEQVGSEKVVMEGGLFWEAYGYYEFVREYLTLLGHPRPTIIEANRPFHNLASILAA